MMVAVLIGVGIGVGCGVVVLLALDRDSRDLARDFARDGIPLCLYWLGLRLMSRECRRETIHSIQQRHTLRGIPDAYRVD